MLRGLLEWLRLGRLQFAGFLCSVMLSGALVMCDGHLPGAQVVSIIVLGVLASFWGFIHNDLCDTRLDRESPALSDRPLVRGTISIRAAQLVIAICIVAGLVIVLVNLGALLPELLLMASMVLAAGYNALSKRLPGSDLLFAGSTALLCVLGGFLALGARPEATGNWNLLLTVAAIQFLDYVVFNAGATLKDVENDRARSAVTMATVCGVTVDGGALRVTAVFRSYLTVLRTVALSAAILAPAWSSLPFSATQTVALAALAATSLCLTSHALRLNTFDRKIIGRRWVAQDAAAKLVVPLLLIGVIGWQWALALALLPPAWFAAWNGLLHRKAFSLRKGF